MPKCGTPKATCRFMSRGYSLVSGASSLLAALEPYISNGNIPRFVAYKGIFFICQHYIWNIPLYMFDYIMFIPLI